MSGRGSITSFFAKKGASAGENGAVRMLSATQKRCYSAVSTCEETGVKRTKGDLETEEFCYLAQRIEPSWRQRLEPELQSSYFKSLDKFLQAEENKQTIYPPKELVFSAFDFCPFDKTRVVILGQDPYHGPNQANGLCFSVQPDVRVPPSLVNIFKEAQSDVGIKKPSNGDLSRWAKQGVLLLNNVLTVRKGIAHSHKARGWERFTDAVVRHLNEEKEGLVFLLWGLPAQKKGAIVDRKRHLVITSSHPSPLGATKTKQPFIGSKCFSRVNEYLTKNGGEPIKWGSK
mmetsp:Transcript_17540/g.28389  ORF Transcript_17540/g.28389 Transcript_17540/m.28389 type:complete len:287 (+) Transcript_17540:287-1147(+)|eukprot:CAMPEP_0203774924 /NCGR_PEP_ID=MMETSP0099_2-20121227/5695_1 /ASSEMBLY_ACC=CAM_ASM_000209 /TAXON_ID=96639 /ORGANISM=" , Strain NY0313808BC1" /LENGTH=286 /DNA_ID=CAMNT_0050673343 /DNA_START=185 /DNA_END=1045 /DNA_ORIENTATION=-